MKKLLSSLLVIISAFCMTSCVSTYAAEIDSAPIYGPSVYGELYYNSLNNYIIVYIDGIPNYRFYDYSLRSYYYRPVPRAHFSHIRHYSHHNRPRPVVHHNGHHNNQPNHHMNNRPHSQHHHNMHPGGNHNHSGRPMHNGGGHQNHHFGGHRR